MAMKFNQIFRAIYRFAGICSMVCLLALVNATGLNAREGGTLYGVESGRNLVAIDLENVQITEVGDIGFGVDGLAFHPPTGELFGIGLVDSDRQLVRIDRSTGLGEVVGPIGFRNAGEIAYNPSNGGFYSTAADSIGGPTSLIQIDAGTGAGDLIGETDFLGFSGLAYDDRDNSLFGVAALVSDPSSTELVFVDSTTGTGVGGGRIDFTPEGFPTGLTYDPFSDQLLLSLQGFSDPFGFFSVPQTIYGINKQTSEIESFTFFTPNYSIGSLAFVPNAIPEPGAGCVLMFGLTGSLLRRRR